MYLHYDNEHDEWMTLHDCFAEKASLVDGVLTFYFSDGFWITPNHEASHLEETVRTDASEVRFHLENEDPSDVWVYVYTEKEQGKALRKEWELQELIDRINEGYCRLEFLYQYKSFHARIVECWLWLKKKPYHKPCDLKISTDKVTYCWNHLREDRRW